MASLLLLLQRTVCRWKTIPSRKIVHTTTATTTISANIAATAASARTLSTMMSPPSNTSVVHPNTYRQQQRHNSHDYLNCLPYFQSIDSTTTTTTILTTNCTFVRNFCTTQGGSGGGNNNNNNNNNNNDNDDDDDPFGVNFHDGTDLGKLGPDSPPKYKRDAVTGKFTGEQEEELSRTDKKLLNMDPIEEQEYVVDTILKEWNIDTSGTKDDDTSSGVTSYEEPKQLSRLAQRIRQDNMGLNTLGRSVQAQNFRGTLEDGDDAYVDETGFTKPLSPAEFTVFQHHMRDEYGMDITEDDIPVEPTNNINNKRGGSVLVDNDPYNDYADNDELTNQWMSSNAMRFMDDTKDDDPFSDLLPSDMSPARLVNRRQAKPIPRQLFHHNNLPLLRRYITPSGQIMNRVQSRLGAKDQRKMAKLIKRARHLGLIPTSGQFIVEAHGNIHEDDIHDDREWEKELKRRGLTIKGSTSTSEKK